MEKSRWRGTCKTSKRPLVKQVWSPGEQSGPKARMERPGCECPGIQITQEKKGLATDSGTMPTGEEPEKEAFFPYYTETSAWTGHGAEAAPGPG